MNEEDKNQLLKLYLAVLVLAQHLPKENRYAANTNSFMVWVRPYRKHESKAGVWKWSDTRHEWLDIGIEAEAASAEYALFALKKVIEAK